MCVCVCLQGCVTPNQLWCLFELVLCVDWHFSTVCGVPFLTVHCIYPSQRSNNHLTYVTGCKERKESTSNWIPIQTSRIFVFGSETFPELTVHVTLWHLRWDYISLDHPACSVKTFQKTVHWAAKPSTSSRTLSQKNVPMLCPSRKNCTNIDFVNDFHIHTEVSSVERGNHLHFARHVFYQGVKTAWACAWYIPIVPLPCW